MSTEIDWVPTAAEFATRLALVRHRMGWNAKEAALACGVSAQSWREWELQGRRPRDYENVCKQIAARTGVDLVWLMTGIDRRGPNGPGGGLPTDPGPNLLLPRVDSNHEPSD